MKPDLPLDPSYGSRSQEDLFALLQTAAQGLDEAAAQGRNQLKIRQKNTSLALILHQFKSSLVLILVFAPIISILTGAWVDAAIVIAIILADAFLQADDFFVNQAALTGEIFLVEEKARRSAADVSLALTLS